MKPSRTLALLLTASGVAACGADADLTPPGDEARSTLTRDLSPAVPAADQTALVDGNTAFAVDLYHQLSGASGNVFYSPHSISVALGMTYAGARGNTEAEMAQAMQFQLPQARLHPAFDWLDLELASRGQGATGVDGKPFRLRIANALFAQQGFSLEPSFLDTLAVNYGAGVSLLDFAEATEVARQKINDWVSDATEARIPELLEQGVLTPNTRLVLTNAVYFNASWLNRFDEDFTQDGTFHGLAGDTPARLMHQMERFPYYDGPDFDAVALPYDGEELDMLVILPDDFASFEASFDSAALTEAIDGLSDETVQLTFPSFEFRFKQSLVEPMKALGMQDAFQNADFSGMNPEAGLVIQDIVHEAFVKVNEGGTEAAAATAVVVGETSVPVAVPFIADRPFMFFIRDRATGAVVFLGRVVEI